MVFFQEIYRRRIVVGMSNDNSKENKVDKESSVNGKENNEPATSITSQTTDAKGDGVGGTSDSSDDIPNKTPKPESSTQPQEEQDTNEAKDRLIQIKRQLKLREFCKKRKNQPPVTTAMKNLKDFHFIYSDKASTIYCYVPKVACTNWKRVFQVFDGKATDPLATGKKQKVHFLKYNTFDKLSLDDISWRQNVYYSFLFVRHPFERVLSAYRNKFKDPYNTQYQKRYGAKVLRMFRANLTEAEYKAGKNVTFPEFVQYIIKTHKTYGYYGLNEHWNSMQDLCHPCSIKYDFIGKMDSLVQDSETVLQEIGWDDRVKFPVKAKDKYKKDLSALVKDYYAQIPKQLMDELYAIYKDDFDAFGYSTEGYL